MSTTTAADLTTTTTAAVMVSALATAAKTIKPLCYSYDAKCQKMQHLQTIASAKASQKKEKLLMKSKTFLDRKNKKCFTRHQPMSAAAVAASAYKQKRSANNASTTIGGKRRQSL